MSAELGESMVPAVEIPLAGISDKTKDFLLAASAAGKSVTEVIAEHLDRAASAAGFSAVPAGDDGGASEPVDGEG